MIDVLMNPMRGPGSASPSLRHDARQLVEQARAHVASTANSALTVLYWQVGDRLRREVLGETRAEYGEQMVSTRSTQWVQAYGQSFGLRSLRRMVQFSEVFPDAPIVAALSLTLSRSHFIEILPLKAPLERAFYAEMFRIERWSVRTLRERIASQLYLRSAITPKPEAVIAQAPDPVRQRRPRAGGTTGFGKRPHARGAIPARLARHAIAPNPTAPRGSAGQGTPSQARPAIATFFIATTADIHWPATVFDKESPCPPTPSPPPSCG
ncbi:MAG: DUF1016 N-terminal domain-containing protein [Burkholderiaceae bacterium]|nr:DUF1016 N-terminal domain-containing protein [Burkholderiaceae bacterium]